MHPGITHLQTLFTTLTAGFDLPYLSQMRTGCS
jgi:hypothetical protein